MFSFAEERSERTNKNNELVIKIPGHGHVLTYLQVHWKP